MKLFLDANVLVSVLNKEYPVYTYSSRILSLAGQGNITLFTSPICLAIAFYFAEKKSGAKKAKSKIELLVSRIEIAESDKATVLLAVQNPAIHDFEDGLEYYAAVGARCDRIITEDLGDFHFSEIIIMNSEQFLKHYLASPAR